MPPTITDMHRPQKSAADLLARQLLSCLLAVGLSGPLQAWGPEAHAAIGMLALGQLQPGARARLDRILAGPEGETMRAACNWPDAVREEEAWKWSARLHYIDLPRGAVAYSQTRDCPDRMCATEAIKTYAKRLANPAASRRQRSRALAWLCHLVGDLHQPLHAGYADDRGGNDFEVTFNGQQMNLHAFWDSALIRQHAADWQALTRLLTDDDAAKAGAGWTPQMVDQWTNESHRLVRDRVYPSDPVLSRAYENKAWILMRQRLRAAGTHLAQLLNTVLGDPPAAQPEGARRGPGTPLQDRQYRQQPY